MPKTIMLTQALFNAECKIASEKAIATFSGLQDGGYSYPKPSELEAKMTGFFRDNKPLDCAIAKVYIEEDLRMLHLLMSPMTPSGRPMPYKNIAAWRL